MHGWKTAQHRFKPVSQHSCETNWGNSLLVLPCLKDTFSFSWYLSCMISTFFESVGYLFLKIVTLPQPLKSHMVNSKLF